MSRCNLILPRPLARVTAAENAENGRSPVSPRRIQSLNVDVGTLHASQALRIVLGIAIILHNAFVICAVQRVFRPGFARGFVTIMSGVHVLRGPRQCSRCRLKR